MLNPGYTMLCQGLKAQLWLIGIYALCKNKQTMFFSVFAQQAHD